MPKQEAVLEPQEDADASSELDKRFGKSVDTGATEPEPEPTEVETEVEEVAEEPESEVESSPAEVEALEKKADPLEPDPEYGEKVKARIDKLTDSWRQSERGSMAKDQRITELEQQLQSAQPAPEPLKTLADFEFDDAAYQSYLSVEISKLAKEAAKEELKDFQAGISNETRESEFRGRERDFAKDVPEYFEKVYGTVDGQRNWQCTDLMKDRIYASDMGEQTSFYLANNPDVASELSMLSDGAEVIARMAVLEHTLKTEKAKAAAPTKVTDAPPPPPTIPAGDEGLQRGFREGMSDKEFNKLRRKQIANR